MLKSTNKHESFCLQGAPSSLTKRNSAEGSKLSAAGLATQGSADSMQPSIKPGPSSKAEDTSVAVTSVLPPSVSVGLKALTASAGLKQEAAAALPMEVDDDAMFQRKPSRAVKPDPSEVGLDQCYYDQIAHCYSIILLSYATVTTPCVPDDLSHRALLLQWECERHDCFRMQPVS